MLTMDVFRNNAFSAVSMSAAVDTMGYVPNFLGSLPGLFVPQPVRTTDIFIEERGNGPALIQTDERGAPPQRRGAEKRTVRSFRTLRISQASTIQAHELQNIRAFGSETELQQLQVEVARRQLLMRNDVDLTMENMRLGAVQGLVVDADGSTLFDWAAQFGQTIPAEIDFDLDNAAPASGVVRKLCNSVTRTMLRNLGGLGGNNVSVVGICGDDFWDLLTAHPEIRQTYLNTIAAAELREGNAWESFRYGGITWINYRGTDDNSKVAVPASKVKFFPVGAGIFQIAYAPAERFEFVNTLGQQVYSWVVPDKDRDSFVDVEMYSYPLPVCTMPKALHRGKMT